MFLLFFFIFQFSNILSRAFISEIFYNETLQKITNTTHAHTTKCEYNEFTAIVATCHAGWCRSEYFIVRICRWNSQSCYCFWLVFALVWQIIINQKWSFHVFGSNVFVCVHTLAFCVEKMFTFHRIFHLFQTVQSQN